LVEKLVLFLGFINDFLFIYLFAYIVQFFLIEYMYNFFYLNLDFLNYTNTLKNLYVYNSFIKNKNIWSMVYTTCYIA